MNQPIKTPVDNYRAQPAATAAKKAATTLAIATGNQKSKWLQTCATNLIRRSAEILAANTLDLQAGQAAGLNSALLDRLTLNDDRLTALAQSLLNIGELPEPVGEIIDSTKRPNGLLITKVRVPLGLVFFIYESRPNVTIDAAALCIKSGNAVILRGGKEAIHSNRILHSILTDSLIEVGLPADAVQLVPTTDRSVVDEFLKMNELIDVTIPRGGKSLIERVTANATMPVIKHYDGICHVYVDASAEEPMAIDIILNSKCQRPGVCNAAETLLIHKDAAQKFWHRMASELQKNHVELRCCERSIAGIPNAVAVTAQDYATEYLDLILSVRIVDSLEDAIHHIAEYGSGHTDAIVTSDLTAAQIFQARIDSAAVIVNASTRFNDGGEFGLGAEIGISTDRFHARGPCGLREIMSYKYVVHGAGQVR